MITIFNEYAHESSILDDFNFYERQQENVAHKNYPSAEDSEEKENKNANDFIENNLKAEENFFLENKNNLENDNKNFYNNNSNNNASKINYNNKNNNMQQQLHYGNTIKNNNFNLNSFQNMNLIYNQNNFYNIQNNNNLTCVGMFATLFIRLLLF
jgi:hypothetical protein